MANTRMFRQQKGSDSGRIGKAKNQTMEIPPAFLVAENGDVVKARERYQATVEWRKQMKVDTILTVPQTHYDTIKTHYTQFLHKHDKFGHPLYFEKIGSINIRKLKKCGVSQETLFNHYLFAMEFTLKYAAHRICSCDACFASQTQKLCIVMDARGMGVRDVGGESFDFIRRCMGVMQRHYPQRSFRIFIVNVPSWFGIAWKALKPLMNEATRAKTSILTESKTAGALLKVIDAQNLPVEYGGTCACVGGCEENSTYQKLQRALVDSVRECRPFECGDLTRTISLERSCCSLTSSEEETDSPSRGAIKRETPSTVLDQLFRVGLVRSPGRSNSLVQTS